MVVELAIEGLTALATPFIQPIFIYILYWVVQSLATILSIWGKGDRNLEENGLNTLYEPGTYDLIVVGAGSGGAIVANRLSRHNYNVLLLEAGGDMNPLQFIPGNLFGQQASITIPQYLNRKTLGGSGSLNLMIHLRGHKNDFDKWANITGDLGWSWEGVLPYFKNYENYEDLGDDVNHGYRGDLRIERPSYIGVAPEFVRAAEELGYPHVDLNAPFTEGFDVIRYPIKNGVRQATYKAFIEPVRTLPSLTIMKYAHVNKIPVKSDLPVGQNLQDHLGVYLSPFLINQPRATFIDRDITPAAFVNWFTAGQGPLMSTGCEASGLFSSDFAKTRGKGHWPDIHLFLFSFTIFRTAALLIANAFNLKIDELVKYYQDHIGARAFSRGYLKLGGSSPYDAPIIDPHYLEDAGEVDLKVLLEGVKKAMILMENTTAFGGELGGTFTKSKLPGCEHYEFRSDPYWICYIRRYSITLHHPVGTASMGKVVDTQLRVIGTKNLRVMDASVQPVIVATNTQASSIMIGEKGGRHAT